MTHGSLFAGIDGFGLAARWAGIETIWQVENDKFCQKILAKHFPEAKRYGDINEIKIGELESVDIISGGFPCQPFSQAGKQGGKKDNRYLWPKMLEVISGVKPRWVIAENVPGIIGMELDTVLSDLEAEGYTTETFIIPAVSLNAPHRRDRVWIVANSNIGLLENEKIQSYKSQEVHRGTSEQINFNNTRIAYGKIWENLYNESDFLRNDDGLSDWVHRIKSLGNAIVPQIAYLFFSAIMEIEK